MAFDLDPEVAAAVRAAAVPAPVVEAAARRGDVRAVRRQTDAALGASDRDEPDSPDVLSEDHELEVSDGASILLRWYTKGVSRPGSAVVFLHGGGMVAGSVDLYDRHVSRYVQETGVPFLSVDYRIAPQALGDASALDGHGALVWLVGQAEALGVDPQRIAVMGDSAGGGVAAAVAIAARDAGTPLARQILIYPMLDDRTELDPHIAPFATWSYDSNHTGWHALLGDDLGAPDVSPLAAPARLADFDGLAPAFIDVGELDVFRDEDLRYALSLTRAGVSCELHLRPGCMHGFDRVAPSAVVSRLSWADRMRVIMAL